MGALTDSLAAAAVSAGATILTGAEVSRSTRRPARSLVGGRRTAAAAPRRHPSSPGAPRPCSTACSPRPAPRPIETEADVEGAQLKVNMLLTRLPRLRDASVDPAAAFAGTFHINEGYAQLEQAYAAAADGRIPDLPPCEIYCHTLSDRSILGADLAASDGPDADALRAAPAGPALPRGQRDRDQGGARGDPALARLRARRADLEASSPATPTATRASRSRAPSTSSRPSACPAATSSTARCSGPGPSGTPRWAPGVSRRHTTTCCSREPGRVAAAGSAGSRATTPRGRCSAEADRQCGQTPELPRRWLVMRWVSTMPTASIKRIHRRGSDEGKTLLAQGF